MKKKTSGFTLIELMVTVAIVGGLAAIAIPAYQDYSIRSQLSEGITLAAGAKPVVAEYYANHGEYPPSNQDAGFAGASGKFITSVEIKSGGLIVATLGNQVNEKIAGKVVVLTPQVNSGTDISVAAASSMVDKVLGINSAMAADVAGWACYSNADAKYLPASCEVRTISNGATDGGSGTPTEPEQPTLDTWSSTTGSRWTFAISGRYSDIGTISYQDIIRTLTIDGVDYTQAFMTSDGTQVFKPVNGSSDYDFIALGGLTSSLGTGSLIYEKKGTNQMIVSSTKNSSGVQTTPQKTVDPSTYPQWMKDYLASTQFKSGAM
ncbi:Pilin-like competence factor ComP [Pandoraea morbifera]|uniref:Pilin-like competence factor ComP n=1 Tax=Pandoraea morbifera TaxID=2508300 RepID=A0A5E4S444_9BURK|nr:pilin [Pandoraea morbifera]VVD68888.1 Pilin-like competence factor ComP [Pandoraea morbifera]